MDLQARLTEAEQSIRSAGTYEQTFPELEYGARLAWRNAGRCIMRQVSFGLVLRDCRHITTARECFEEVVKHLVEASNGGVLVPTITVFRPRNRNNGIRIWNPQLLSYACYEREDGSLLGDPGRLEFQATEPFSVNLAYLLLLLFMVLSRCELLCAVLRVLLC